jgi:hypothetical protein
MDLKDSSSIYSDADHVIILRRKRKTSNGKAAEDGGEFLDQTFDPITLIRVEASRSNAGGKRLSIIMVSMPGLMKCPNNALHYFAGYHG